MTLIKSISGIRGTIGGHTGNTLNPLDIVKFTTAYATFISRQNTEGCSGKIVVGRDGRISGSMVRDVVCGTLVGMGYDVIDIGYATTPTTELAVRWHKADGGIIITASHNPRQWNALKLLNKEGEFLTSTDGAEVLRIAEDEDFNYAEVDQMGKVITDSTCDQRHVDSVLQLQLADVEAIRKRKFRVCADTINSVGGIILPRLFEALGVKNTVALITNSAYSSIAEKMGVNVAVPIRDTVVDSIMSHLRGENVREVHTVSTGGFEIIECDVPSKSHVLGKTLKEIAKPGKFLMLLIQKPGSDGYALVNGNTTLNVGDHVVLIQESGSKEILELISGKD